MHLDPTLMSVSGCALAGVVIWATDEEPAPAELEHEPVEAKTEIKTKEPAAP